MPGLTRLTNNGRRRLRYAAPVAVAAAIGLGAWIPTLPASASPQLPSQSVNQIIARAEQPTVSGFTGTVEWTANLGLPSLAAVTSVGGSSDSGTTWTDLLSGSHQVKVWDGGANGERLALIGSASETDIYSSSAASGHQTWVYDSTTNAATHLVPAQPHATTQPAPSVAAPSTPALTPAQVAQKILQQVGSVTAESVSPATYVAGQPAYVLSLQPKPGAAGAASSTVGRIAIAVDADNGAVLKVSVTAAGASKPALSLGFTTVDFLTHGASLPASDFVFKPSAGTTVTTQVVGGKGQAGAVHHVAAGEQPTTVGSGWDTILVAHGAGRALARAAGSPGSAAATDGVQMVPPPSGPRHWSGHGHGPRRTVRVTSQLNTVTTAVSGPFGTGRLLTTSLVNILILPNGEVLAGFVTSAALEAAAVHAG